MSKRQVSTYTVERCRDAGHPRTYGYTLRVTPPLVINIEGDDVEGIGWVPRPRTATIKFKGWYKYKSDAQRRADEFNAGTP